MTQIDLIKLLKMLAAKHQKRVFTARELSALAHESRASTAMTLLRAAEKELVFRVGNYWVNNLDAPSLEDLGKTLQAPSYVSFENALYHHGALSQSPKGSLSLATLGRSCTQKTPLGTIRYIHLKPSLFFGFNAQMMAEPEKAFLDLIYVRMKKGMKPVLTETVYWDRFRKETLKKFSKKFPRWVGAELQKEFFTLPHHITKNVVQ